MFSNQHDEKDDEKGEYPFYPSPMWAIHHIISARGRTERDYTMFFFPWLMRPLGRVDLRLAFNFQDSPGRDG